MPTLPGKGFAGGAPSERTHREAGGPRAESHDTQPGGSRRSLRPGRSRGLLLVPALAQARTHASRRSRHRPQGGGARWTVPSTIDVLDRDRLITGSVADLRHWRRSRPGSISSHCGADRARRPCFAASRSRARPETTSASSSTASTRRSATAIDVAPLDVERMEVVQGPQSTLFGHSTFTGAIHYVPRAATREFERRRARRRFRRLLAASGFLSGPLPGTGAWTRCGGFLERVRHRTNSADGNSLGDYRRVAVAASVESGAEAPLHARLSGRWSEVRSSHLRLAPSAQPNTTAARSNRRRSLELLLRRAAADGSIRAVVRHARQPQQHSQLCLRSTGRRIMAVESVTSYYRGATTAIGTSIRRAPARRSVSARFRRMPLGGPPLPVARLRRRIPFRASRLKRRSGVRSSDSGTTGRRSTGWSAVGILTREVQFGELGFERGALAPANA